MNFLRPVYTGYLFKQLQKQSLNVYGAAGQGRERLDFDVDKLTALTRNECEQELQRRVLGLPDEHFRLLLPAV